MTERFDHLDPATIAALVDRTLDPDARARAEAHLAECPDCREVWVETSELADVAGGTERKPGGHVVIARRVPMRRWIYAGAGLAAAAAVLIFMFTPAMLNRDGRPELRELVAAVGENRRTEGRLTGGFSWGPAPGVTRGARQPSDAAVDLAATQLAALADASRRPSDVAAAGTAAVIMGRSDLAIERLERATTMDAANAAAWSDLSAAFLERSRLTGDRAAVQAALDAADRALSLFPTLPEARFNRALALGYLGRSGEARAAWDAYLAIDRTSPWAEEARSRQKLLRNN